MTIIIRSLFFMLFFFESLFVQAFEVPVLTGPVVDQLEILSQKESFLLRQRLQSMARADVAQIQIFIPASLNNEPIESVAIQVFDQWKLGSEKKDNGILFIVAPKERKLRIEIGQGLEGAIPDILAKRMINELAKPLLQAGQVGSALQLTVEALVQAVLYEQQGKVFNVVEFKQALLNGQTQVLLQSGAEPLQSQDLKALQDTQKSNKKKLPLSTVVIGLFVLWLIVFFISPATALQLLFMFLSSGGRSGYGGGSSSGGGWSGGGGRSSGGGASGSW